VDGRQANESAEIRDVEGENVIHVMDVHGCSQTRVVHLDSGDGVLQNQPPPLAISRGAIREKNQGRLDPTHFVLCVISGESESIASKRTCHRVPKLSDVLVGVKETRALRG
jgi:hypothetical protein